MKNIFVLRTVEDANQIKDALTPSANVVILGSSFIGGLNKIIEKFEVLFEIELSFKAAWRSIIFLKCVGKNKIQIFC